MSGLQQVNLYSQELRPRKEPFTFVAMLWAWGLIVILLASFQLWGWYQSGSARDRLADMQRQEARVLQQLKGLKDSTPKKNAARVENNLSIVKAEVVQQQQLLSVMEGQNIGNSYGFSDQLISLSRQHKAGLSLDYFDILEGGTYIELSGWAHKPEMLPDYIQRLKKEDSFENTRFGDMTFERIVQERPDALRFSMGSAGEGK